MVSFPSSSALSLPSPLFKLAPERRKGRFYLGQVGVERPAGAQEGLKHGGDRPENEEVLLLQRKTHVHSQPRTPSPDVCVASLRRKKLLWLVSPHSLLSQLHPGGQQRTSVHAN